MGLNKIEVSYIQNVIQKGKDEEIGFLHSEETKHNYGVANLKYWIGWYLIHWYQLRILQCKQVFNLNMPIIITVKWDNKITEVFTQVRVSKKFAESIKKEPVIPLKKSHYVLRPYSDTIKSMNIPSSKTISPSSHNRAKMVNFNEPYYFNTVEHYSKESPKYGTPVLFTGWTN